MTAVPIPHQQPISTVTGLQPALDAKVAGVNVLVVHALTQAEYNAIGTKSATTLYIIRETI